MVKHIQAIRLMLPTNCLSVFDHFVGLALKKSTYFTPVYHFNIFWKRQNISGIEKKT